MTRDKAVGRRVFLTTVAAAGAGVATLACSAAGGDSAPPRSCAKPSDGAGLPVCLTGKILLTLPDAATLEVGQVAIMALDDASAAIVARDERGFYALSGTCTHACCTVTLCTDETCAAPVLSPNECAPPKTAPLVRAGPAFLCPCHGSAFAADGSVVNGPARQPLPAVKLSLVGRDAVVDLSRPANPTDRIEV